MLKKGLSATFEAFLFIFFLCKNLTRCYLKLDLFSYNNPLEDFLKKVLSIEGNVLEMAWI